jgi:hypothetical protein
VVVEVAKVVMKRVPMAQQEVLRQVIKVNLDQVVVRVEALEARMHSVRQDKEILVVKARTLGILVAVAVVLAMVAALLQVHLNHVVKAVMDCTVPSLAHQLGILAVVDRWVEVVQLHMVVVIHLLLVARILEVVEAHMLTAVLVLS